LPQPFVSLPVYFDNEKLELYQGRLEKCVLVVVISFYGG